MADASESTTDLLRAGAERFRALLHLLRAETERQFSERTEDVEAGIDVRDYPLLARMVEEQLPHCPVTREGFMRSLADVLCICVDGCGISIDDPIRLEPIGGGCATITGTAELKPVDTSQLRKVRRKSGGRDIGDAWVGTAEAIVAAGMASLDEFPGQAGRPKSSVAYRPAAGKQDAYCWDRAPGYRRITRVDGGCFRIDVTASSEEQDRRVEALHAALPTTNVPATHSRGVRPRLRLAWSAAS